MKLTPAELDERQMERQGAMAEAEAEAERQFADYWGGTGPDYEAAVSEHLQHLATDPEAAAERELEWPDNWDSAGSDAYQARVEAGSRGRTGG